MRALRTLFVSLFVFVATACGAGNVSSVTPGSGSATQSLPAPVYQAPLDDSSSSNVEAAGVVSSFPIGDGGMNDKGVADIEVGADGKFYFAVQPVPTGTPFPTSGEIGAFSPTALTQTFQTVSYMPAGIREVSNGAVFVQEFNNASGTPTIDRYAGLGGPDTPLTFKLGSPVFAAPWNGFGTNFVIGADGELWFGSGVTGNTGEINLSSNAVKIYSLNTPSGGVAPGPQFLILGSDHGIWTTDANNDGVVRVTSSGPSKGANFFTALPQGFGSAAFSPQGIAEGADSKLYIGNIDTSGAEKGALDEGAPSNAPSFSSLTLPALGIQPYLFAKGKSGNLYFNDVHFSGLGVYNTTTGSMVDLPLTPAAFGQVVTDSTGTPWLACTMSTGSACVERVKLSSVWHVFPSTSIKLYTKGSNGASLPPGLVGIGETGNSGPFTVVSKNATICTASVIGGFDHNIQVNPLKAGKCTLAITDAHARTVDVLVDVISGTGSPQMRVHFPTFKAPL